MHQNGMSGNKLIKIQIVGEMLFWAFQTDEGHGMWRVTWDIIGAVVSEAS